MWPRTGWRSFWGVGGVPALRCGYLFFEPKFLTADPTPCFPLAGVWNALPPVQPTSLVFVIAPSFSRFCLLHRMDQVKGTCDGSSQTTPHWDSDTQTQNLQILWNILQEAQEVNLTSLPKAEKGSEFYQRVVVGQRSASTVYRDMNALLGGRPNGQLLNPVWVLYAMLREECSQKGMNLQGLIDSDQRNCGARKRNLGSHAYPAHKRNPAHSAASAAPSDASDASNALDFRILDRFSG